MAKEDSNHLMFRDQWVVSLVLSLLSSRTIF